MGNALVVTDVEIGPFKMPGLKINEFGKHTADELNKWCEERGIGVQVSEKVWRFKSQNQRTMFLLRWGGDT
jgi:hypothetical protein